MPRSVFSLEFEQICLSCYLPLEMCPEFADKPTREQQAVCPLRVAIKHKLTGIQGQQLSEVARLRGYTPENYLKMVHITVERNGLIAGTV